MISFVYFDVGGVVINDCKGNDKWEKMMREIGIKKEDDDKFNEFYEKYEKEVSIGKDIDSIIPLIKKIFGVNFPAGYSMLADFINRFEKNIYIQPVIDKIKQNCKMGLLTNMYPRMLSAMTEKGIMPEANWDVIIDSTVERLRKPDSAIFELAERKANAKKDEILFIDNTTVNINTAKDFGWRTFFYNSSDHKKSCADLLDFYEKIRV
ncbi:MAG: HAD-IA family hydrolase [Candidatus Paceibacterota bacterium]